MNKPVIQTLRSITTALFLAFTLAVLTACGAGTGNPSTGSTADAAAETEAGAESDETTPESRYTIVLPEGFEDGLVYQKNDVTIQITNYRQFDLLEVLSCDITNNGSEPLSLKMLPLLINGEVTADGYYITLSPSEPKQVEYTIDMEEYAFAGLKEIKTIDAFLEFEDEDGYPVADPEIIRLVQNDANPAAPSLQHSTNVVYDADGIKMSYLGSFMSTYEENKAVYLVSNDSEKTIHVDNDYTFSMVDGTLEDKSKDKKEISCFSEEIPPGTKSLFTLSVMDSEDYTPTSFETADTRILFRHTKAYKDFAEIPVHLTMEGDSILSSVDDSYYNDYFSTACDTYQLPTQNQLNEYFIFYYEKGSRNLQGIVDETVIPKSTGISREDLEISLKKVKENYSGIDSLDFVEFMIDDDEENFYIFIIGRELDDSYNFRDFINTGYLRLPDSDLHDPVSVDDYLRYMEKNDCTKIPQEDYEANHIRADLF